MSKLNHPAEFGNNAVTWIMLIGIMVILIVLNYGIDKKHDNLHSHMVTERKALQHEITKLREELKVHDQKSEWFERKEYSNESN